MNEYNELDELLVKAEYGLLDENEKKRLEELLANSTNLEKTYALHDDFNQAFIHPEDMEIKGQIDAIFNREHKRKLLRLYSGIAATIVLLIGVSSIYLWNANKSIDGEDLFTDYYVSPSLALDRAPVSLDDSIYQLAVIYYNHKDFKEASVLFSKLISSDTSNTFYLLYSGICALELTQQEVALRLFDKIIQLNDPATKESALWYSGLCFLKINDISKAKKVFEDIELLNGDYRDDSKTIIKKLNKH